MTIKTRLIYRVETSDSGMGPFATNVSLYPYIDGTFYAWARTNAYRLRRISPTYSLINHPAPNADVHPDNFKRFFRYWHHKCSFGFASLNQYKSVFRTRIHRKALRDYRPHSYDYINDNERFVLAVYEVDSKYAAVGVLQAIFLKSRAELVDILDPLTLKPMDYTEHDRRLT